MLNVVKHLLKVFVTSSIKVRFNSTFHPLELATLNNSSDRVDRDDVRALFQPGRCSEQQLEVFASTSCQLICIPLLFLAYCLKFFR